MPVALSRDRRGHEFQLGFNLVQRSFIVSDLWRGSVCWVRIVTWWIAPFTSPDGCPMQTSQNDWPLKPRKFWFPSLMHHLHIQQHVDNFETISVMFELNSFISKKTCDRWQFRGRIPKNLQKYVITKIHSTTTEPEKARVGHLVAFSSSSPHLPTCRDYDAHNSICGRCLAKAKRITRNRKRLRMRIHATDRGDCNLLHHLPGKSDMCYWWFWMSWNLTQILLL